MQQHQSENNPCLSKEIANLDDTAFEQLTDYIYSPYDVKEFAEQKYVNLYEAKGYQVLNDKKSIGNVGYSRKKWSKKLCLIEALKYTTRWDFQKNSVNAYTASRSHGWLNSICSHMESAKKPPHYWTKENCILKAKKYKSRNEFRRKSSYVYKIVTKNGWTEEVCAHIPTIIYRKWEKENTDVKLWEKAQIFYEEWIKLNQCSGYVLSRRYKLIRRFNTTGNKNY